MRLVVCSILLLLIVGCSVQKIADRSNTRGSVCEDHYLECMKRTNDMERCLFAKMNCLGQ